MTLPLVDPLLDNKILITSPRLLWQLLKGLKKFNMAAVAMVTKMQKC